MGLFGNLFDFNGNGKLDTLEKAAELATLASIMEEEAGLDPDDYKDL